MSPLPLVFESEQDMTGTFLSVCVHYLTTDEEIDRLINIIDTLHS